MEKIIKKRYLSLLLIVLSVISIFIGVSNMSLQILLISRLPRLMSIVIAGIGLSVSGLIMQQISRNKFVSPTTAATTDFAKLGVLVGMLCFGSASLMTKMVIAFIFALAGTVLFMKLIKVIKIKNVIFVPLIGMMLGKIVGSVTTFFSFKFDLVQNISSWMQGDLSGIMSGNYEMLYLSIPVVLIGFLYANQFTIAGMGEEFSVNLGLNYNLVVNIGLGVVALITAVTLITVGNIPFLGLIIPNIVSLYMGDNLKNTLYHTSLLGPIFLLVCDIFGRLIIFPFELSIGLTVGVIGGIIFLCMILRRVRNER